MDIALTRTVSLLGVAILVAIIARRLRLPYTVGLAITGIGLAADALLAVTHAFLVSTVRLIPPGPRQTWLAIFRRELEELPSHSPEMPLDTYFDRPYEGFWSVSEKERRLAEQAGRPDQAHADLVASQVQLEATLAQLPPYVRPDLPKLN
jgi:hypothetical protein